jgi:hypothetical protein
MDDVAVVDDMDTRAARARPSARVGDDERVAEEGFDRKRSFSAWA